jgi:hypothetical protein
LVGRTCPMPSKNLYFVAKGEELGFLGALAAKE